MRFEEYRRYDALGLAELVTSGQVTALELLECALARAKAVAPRLNPIVHWFEDEARQRAATPLQGPFAGVPFLLKDAGQDLAGHPTSQGSRAFQAHRAPISSTYAERAHAAGLISFGKTNTPELAFKGITEPEAFGPTRNPWAPTRTPGGSSGGAAAAVASGIVPMAGANDGGGSIRIPAAYCGLFGLRPSRGRVPAGPRDGEVWDGASSEHVITRSVRDSAAMLDALSGPDCGAPFVIAPPERSFREELERAPEPLTIAYSLRSPLDRPVHPECKAALESTLRLLEELGHRVEEAEPRVDGKELAITYLKLYFAVAAATVERLDDKRFELETRLLAMLGRSMSSGEYFAARQRWNTYSRALGEFFQRYDLYLTPTVADLPARIGELALPASQRLALRALLRLRAGRLLWSSGMIEQIAMDSLARTPFTQLANLTGTPAMSVPLYWTADGMPLGSQFIGPFGSEGLLLRLAAQLERARPWLDRVPPEEA